MIEVNNSPQCSHYYLFNMENDKIISLQPYSITNNRSSCTESLTEGTKQWKLDFIHINLSQMIQRK